MANVVAPLHHQRDDTSSTQLPFSAKPVDFSQRARWKCKGFLIPSDEQVLHLISVLNINQRHPTAAKRNNQTKLKKRKPEDPSETSNDWFDPYQQESNGKPPSLRRSQSPTRLDNFAFHLNAAVAHNNHGEPQPHNDEHFDKSIKEKQSMILESNEIQSWVKPTRRSVSSANSPKYEIKTWRRRTIHEFELSSTTLMDKTPNKPAAASLSELSSPESPQRESTAKPKPASRGRIFQLTSKRVHHRLRQSKLSFGKKTWVKKIITLYCAPNPALWRVYIHVVYRWRLYLFCIMLEMAFPVDRNMSGVNKRIRVHATSLVSLSLRWLPPSASPVVAYFRVIKR